MHQTIAKSYPWHPTAFGLDGVLEGFPAVFGNRDDDGEVIEKGAFAKTLSEHPVTRIPVALDHMYGMAVTRSLEEVGRDDLPNVVKSEHPDATGGLFGSAQIVLLGDGLSWARDEQRRMKSGKPSGMSFVARVIRAEKSRGSTVLSELMFDVDNGLGEWGPQNRNFPVNRAARGTAIKGAADPLGLGTPFDAAADPDELIAFITKAGRMFSAANLAELKAAKKTLDRLIAMAEGQTPDAGAEEKPALGKGRAVDPVQLEREKLVLLRMSLTEV